MAVLDWLCKNNHVYSNVVINQHTLDSLAGDNVPSVPGKILDNMETKDDLENADLNEN